MTIQCVHLYDKVLAGSGRVPAAVLHSVIPDRHPLPKVLIETACLSRQTDFGVHIPTLFISETFYGLLICLMGLCDDKMKSSKHRRRLLGVPENSDTGPSLAVCLPRALSAAPSSPIFLLGQVSRLMGMQQKVRGKRLGDRSSSRACLYRQPLCFGVWSLRYVFCRLPVFWLCPGCTKVARERFL